MAETKSKIFIKKVLIICGKFSWFSLIGKFIRNWGLTDAPLNMVCIKYRIPQNLEYFVLTDKPDNIGSRYQYTTREEVYGKFIFPINNVKILDKPLYIHGYKFDKPLIVKKIKDSDHKYNVIYESGHTCVVYYTGDETNAEKMIKIDKPRYIDQHISDKFEISSDLTKFEKSICEICQKSVEDKDLEILECGHRMHFDCLKESEKGVYSSYISCVTCKKTSC
jgi:hypothetical protein